MGSSRNKNDRDSKWTPVGVKGIKISQLGMIPIKWFITGYVEYDKGCLAWAQASLIFFKTK